MEIEEQDACEALVSGEMELCLYSVDTEVIRILVDALEALQKASNKAHEGFVEDYCENAAKEIRKAIRVAGG